MVDGDWLFLYHNNVCEGEAEERRTSNKKMETNTLIFKHVLDTLEQYKQEFYNGHSQIERGEHTPIIEIKENNYHYELWLEHEDDKGTHYPILLVNKKEFWAKKIKLPRANHLDKEPIGHNDLEPFLEQLNDKYITLLQDALKKDWNEHQMLFIRELNNLFKSM